MSLQPGDRLGPYRIVSLIGAGGMGEVYRAHDGRLGRDVALKVLRRANPDLIARFSREAQAAGSLNHPNIVAVFDVGAEAGVPYVVTELLEGETVRSRLNHGMIPYRKAVDYGIQIANALDAAHAKGIWHRDVKPANVFITQAGVVKLLDFGIAKLTEPIVFNPNDPTVEDTETGEVRGTVGYMSPEQARGQPVDHRADIFSLGTVLYEMFTGTRAFRRGSHHETMTAVLQEDPTDPVLLNAALPPQAAALVRRCLEKNREDRVQSARDLAFDLQQIRDVTGGPRPPLSGRPALRSRIIPAVLVVASLAAGALAARWLLGRGGPPIWGELTFHQVRIGGARFTADGQTVVYSEARQANELTVWRLDVADRPTVLNLRFPVGTDVLATRPGEMAVSLGRRFILGERFAGMLAIAPISGGKPREILADVEDADFDPTDKDIAVVCLSSADGQGSRLEFPLGQVRYQTSGSLRFVRVSPDGQQVAFIEDPGGRGVSGHVKVLDRSGKVRELTPYFESARGLAWSASGDEIWFTAGTARSNRALWAVTLAGTQRLIQAVPGSLTLWDIAQDGRVLMTRDEQRRAIRGMAPGERDERDLSWYDNSGVASISRDGRLILLGDRFGIYVRGTDGSDPVKIRSDGLGDDLSPDGKWALVTADGQRTLVLVPTGAGSPKPVPTHDISNYRGARWFPDGTSLLFTGVDKTGATRSFRQSVDGGPPEPLTPPTVIALAVSPKGDMLATTDAKGLALLRVGGASPTFIEGSRPGDRPIAWKDDGGSLWLFRRNELPGTITRLDLRTGLREAFRTLNPPDAAGVYSIIDAQVTPSGHAYAYTYTRLLSQLYLVGGLK